MSDEDHQEPTPPSSGDLANRIFVISMAGVLSFIAVVYAFVIL